MDESRFKDVLVLAYFKLVDPMGGNFEPLSMMTGYRVNGVKFYDGRMFMGLNLAYDAAPEPGEKVLRFNNASKYGIADLTKWCDDMNRLALSGEIPKVPGFRLSRLLTEIEALAQKKPGNPGPSKSA